MTLPRLAQIQTFFGVASVVLGLMLILLPQTALFDAYNRTIAGAFFGTDALSTSTARMNHWLLATCGAGVVGWGIAWAVIAHIPLRRGERWAYRCLAWSLLAWVGLDVVVAIWFGVFGELVFVSSAFVGAGLPLLLGRSLFVDESAAKNS